MADSAVMPANQAVLSPARLRLTHPARIAAGIAVMAVLLLVAIVLIAAVSPIRIDPAVVPF